LQAGIGRSGEALSIEHGTTRQYRTELIS